MNCWPFEREHQKAGFVQLLIFPFHFWEGLVLLLLGTTTTSTHTHTQKSKDNFTAINQLHQEIKKKEKSPEKMLIELITFFRPAGLVSLLLQPSFCCFEFRTEIQKRSGLHYFSMCSPSQPIYSEPPIIFSLQRNCFFFKTENHKEKK